jgi:hypothetical protein
MNSHENKKLKGVKNHHNYHGLKCCAPINNQGPQLKFLIILTRVTGAKQPNKGIRPPIQCSKDFGGGNNCLIVIVIQSGGQTSF